MEKLYHSFKILFLVLFLAQSINLSHQQLSKGGDDDEIPNNYNEISLPDELTGPESIAFDCKNDGPYVGVSDGRILKFQAPNLGWEEFAIPSAERNRTICDGNSNPDHEPICGRPLGLEFNNATCELYIADAYFGLLKVGPEGGVAQSLATGAEGVPFKFTNGLDIDQKNGVVYFTDSSIFFQRRFHLLLRISDDSTGRLLKYDPSTKQVTVLYFGLSFGNGIALSKDQSFVLVVESNKRRVLKIKLEEANSSSSVPVPEVFADFPFDDVFRTPDNIRRNENGEFWVGLHSGRSPSNHTEDSSSKHLRDSDPVGIRFDQDGKILDQLDGNGGNTLDSISEVKEFKGSLYVGSVLKPYLGILNPHTLFI